MGMVGSAQNKWCGKGLGSEAHWHRILPADSSTLILGSVADYLGSQFYCTSPDPESYTGSSTEVYATISPVLICQAAWRSATPPTTPQPVRGKVSAISRCTVPYTLPLQGPIRLTALFSFARCCGASPVYDPFRNHA